MLFTPTVVHLWIFSGILVFHLLFLLSESWYHFLPNVVVLIVMCFLTGFISGVIYSNGLEVVRTLFVGNKREFSLSVSLLPFDFGMFAASLIGLYVEPRLLEHCKATALDIEYCFTRSSNMEAIAGACKGL